MPKELNVDPESYSGDRGERFMKLYTATQRRLYSYVISLVPSESAVEDIIQETVTFMWKQFDDFESGTDFAAWAFTIAKNQIFNYIKRQQKQKRRFSSKTIQAIEEIAKTKSEISDQRLNALRKCIKKLSDKDRQLLILRYEVGSSLKSVSERIEQSVNTLYSRLYKIRIMLLHCVQNLLQRESV